MESNGFRFVKRETGGKAHRKRMWDFGRLEIYRLIGLISKAHRRKRQKE